MSQPVNPRETAGGGAVEFRSYFRQKVEKEAREGGNNNEVWKTTSSLRWALEVNCLYKKPLGEDLVPNLHDLWFSYYHASKNTCAENPIHDRLALQVINLQARGTLRRLPGEGAADEEVTTTDGTVWDDLPFFVSDMIGFWETDGTSMSEAERVNFSHFLAQLLAVGVAKNRLGGLVLAIFREALETPRSCGGIEQDTTVNTDTKHNSNDNNTTAASMAGLTVLDFLPVVIKWLSHAGRKIVQLSDRRWQAEPTGLGSPGTLFRNDTLVSTSVKNFDGFSPERWIFWMRRLETLSKVETGSESATETPLSKLATDAMNLMQIVLFESYSEVRAVFEAAPQVVQYRYQLLQIFLEGQAGF